MLNKKALAAAVGVPAQYQIERSLRFNSADSTNLTRTFSTNGTDLKIRTVSFWIKRAKLGVSECIFQCYNGTSDYSNGIEFATDDKLYFTFGGATAVDLKTTQVFRDPSAWYHIVFAIDTTQATSSNRVKVYVNGSQITAFDTANYPSQNANSQWAFSNGNNKIGSNWINTQYINMYLAEMYFIDGQALTPSSFGETDADTGIWKPKAFSGTYGTNGFYLDFSDNSGTTSTTLGKDYSGNSNNWTPNNFSVTAGTGNDSLVDTPTPYGTDTGAGGEVRGNYGTWNPLWTHSSITLANGNLQATGASSSNGLATGTIAISSGKWYWESTVLGGSSMWAAGIVKTTIATPNYSSLTTDSSYAWNDTASKYNGQTASSYGASYTTNDVIGIAVDLDAGTVVFYKNGSSQGTAFTGVSGTFVPMVLCNNTASVATNFGQRPFAYTAPSGYKALCTTNLPTPTIGATATTRADDYFNTVLYTGNGSTQSITGVGFQPDFVWLKARTSGGSSFTNHVVVDAVRGAGANGYRNLYPNLTDAEVNPASDQVSVSALNSDGFSLGQNANTNTNTMTAVAWNWKANGAGSSNTAGSITSTVSANTTSGFSIATFTIQTSGSATVGHGLGVAPSLILVKTRNLAFQWDVYHASLGKDAYLVLNDNSAQVTGATTVWNSTAPTSTVFSLGSAWASAAPGNTAVAYCFAPVAGFSAFGSYTGNGSTDGPFIYTGFRPAYVLIKASSSVTYGNWILMDAKRSSFNVADDALYANLSNSEDTTYQLDMLSNGFKIRHSAFDGINGNTKTYIYAAFAENPFKYSLAR